MYEFIFYFLAEQGLVLVYNGGKTFPYMDGTMQCGNSWIHPCPRYTVRSSFVK